ncbi:MAG TPA: hypothetical protein VMR81_03570 [Patescibacteria group bacterium]|jgi:hypothetical protein|nr:hypothetical protein [Patescibacteria group bacterium]
MKNGVEYGPKDLGYQKKSQFISDIASVPDPNVVERILVLFGAELAGDDRFSRKQQEDLIEALQTKEILTYCNAFVASEADPNTVDAVRWDMESDGFLQAKAISTLWGVTHESTDTNASLNFLATLFNHAHKRGFINMEKGAFFDGRYASSVNHLMQAENKLFAARQKTAESLLYAGVINEDNVATIVETADVESLQNCEEFDEMLLARNLQDFQDAHTVVDRLKSLQEVLYLGFTMGVRDWQDASIRASVNS